MATPSLTGQDPSPDSVGAFEPAAALVPRANPHEIAYVLERVADGWQPFAPATDRDAWKAVAAANPAGVVDGLVAAGRTAATRPVPVLTATAWREFMRSGRREGYQVPLFARRTMLRELVLAYALEPDDGLIDPLVDLLWAICEETTWCNSAHDHVEFPDPRRPVVDLTAAQTAVALAECLHVLGPVLPGPLVDRVEREVAQRVTTPYLVDDTWGWMFNSPRQWTNNWTAVCGFGAAGAACYLERDPARLAAILAKAARSMEEYLQGFDPDGGTSEGTGYWGFGFGSFCNLADLVERRTGGAWSWFAAPIVERVARFPLTARLTADSWPTFSDCTPDTPLSGVLLATLGDRFDIAGLRELAASPAADWTMSQQSGPPLSAGLRCLHAGIPATTGPPPPRDTPSSWFRGLQWLVAAADPADPATAAIAVKGGHNAEMHNQNDVGSLAVRFGGENLVVDPGAGHYTRDYFGPGRYTYFVNGSYGHSVPLPAGVEQVAGVQRRARVVEIVQGAAADRITLDLTAAYPDEAGLERLERTVALYRDATPWVELVDEVSFAEPAVAETAFVTFGAVELTDGGFVLRGERAAAAVTLPPGTIAEVSRHDVPVGEQIVRAVSRVAVRSSGPVRQARFAFRIIAA